MARDWPAKDIAPLIELIADPRHTLAADGTYRLSDEQAQAILELRLQRLTALGRDEIGDELQEARRGDHATISTSCARASRILDIIKGELAEVKAEFATPRRTEILEIERRARRRGPDPARGHGRHRHPRRLHQARAALDLSGAAARRQGPLRHVDARRGFRHASCSSPPRTRRCCSSPRAAWSTRMKVWRLPLATPQARGKALINLLPLEQGERITTILPLPEDEETWDDARRDVRDRVAATSGATSCPTSPTSTATARSR